ncbi:hypothetical protein U9M48_037396 [Paspalum notatum var. saurae]|uniref:Uncharacterized protein n=1 Tax=Paspalum notatum var. saurae TaxID=547442 RepID=A0AAQ3UJ80_PASNO
MASRLLIIAVALLCAMADGQEEDNIFKPWPPDCSTTRRKNYTYNSQCKQNLDQLLAALPVAARDNGWFYQRSVGTGDDEVFGLVMCYADYSAAMCQECLSSASAEITRMCPGSRNVSAVYDACVLRYSDMPIPATADLNYLYIRNLSIHGVPIDSQSLVTWSWMLLMRKLVFGVASSPLRLAEDTSPYSSLQEIYGLAQCTRDLNGTECSRCIKNYTNQLGSLLPNYTSGVIKGYSCYLLYDVNITLPPGTAPAPALPRPSMPAAPGPSSSNTQLVIGLSVGAASSLIVLASLIWIHRLWHQKQAKILREARERELEEGDFFDDEPEMEDEFEKGTGPKRFCYGELAIATHNFSDKQKLGEGGFGSVYRGYLKDIDLHVAIKRVSKGSKQGRKEYASEVRIISRLRHRNLVRLIGWCHGGGELLLVYELMPNGSLDKYLYGGGDDTLLPWPIVLGLASALLYLHEEWEQCVLHRDIKPSNVILDAAFHAKLGDFGLARLVDHGRGSHTTVTVLAGTMGYLDPECMITGRASVESSSS